MVRSALGYLDLIRARALMEVATEARDHSRAQAELSRQMVDVQAELRVNLARALAAEARDEQRLLAAKNEARGASIALSVLLRLEPGTDLEPVDDRIEPLTLVSPERELGELIESAVESRPDLRELAALSRAARERRSGAKISPWVPDLDVAVGWSYFGGGSNDNLGHYGDRVDMGAGLMWTFEGFGFGDAARARRATAVAQATRLQVEGKREEIVGEVIRTWETISSLRASIDAAQSRVEASREAVDLVQARYESGDAIQLEILAARRNDAESRAGLVNAIIEYSKAQNVLHYQVHGAAWEKG
jgi:outer membrane protein TolC